MTAPVLLTARRIAPKRRVFYRSPLADEPARSDLLRKGLVFCGASAVAHSGRLTRVGQGLNALAGAG